jgi:cell wall-associated NlpC family hydrolase
MSERGEEIVRRARALVGAPFRPQGRDPDQGLDCIGVAIMATGIPKGRVRRDYRLRGHDPEEVDRDFHESGFIRIGPADAEPGDVLLVRPAATALHLVILTDAGYLHADLRLRRVVEVPGPVPWPALSAWRHVEQSAADPLSPALVDPASARRLN